MGKRNKKPRQRVYHDGLIPATHDTFQSYPEVVPDDYDQPNGPLPLSAPPPPPAALMGLPRTSGVHSLRQAWSDPGDPEDPHAVPLDADRPPLWKRPVLWVALVAGAVIVVLAGLLGGVASGRVGTAGGSTISTSSVADPSCPGSGNRNYTSSAAAALPKTFRIQCGANYPGGDGTLGLQSGAADSIASCFDACARESGCVAAVFRPGDAAECWLKEFVGVVEIGGDARGMVSGVLWQ
ncbi:hypothetical protein B0I37DRAFT_448676 [Chaetomium sp. MPI-CAGE-AT-0009]|nr:hypothetical protein B0I37DRAFT_448676 [Chaetomium sp. MPI-CAGE-AT-0009]